MNCIYCGKSAGFFQRTHPECVQSHENGKHQIFSLASSMQSPQLSLNEIQGNIKNIATTSHISETEQHRLILNGWVAAVNKVLAEDPPGNDEVQRLMTGVTQFAFSASDMAAGGGVFFRLM